MSGHDLSRWCLIWLMVLCCGSWLAPAAQAADDSLLLYCGAGLRQPVEEIIQGFEKETGLKVRMEFAGSGQLLAHYQASGQGDVLLPGSQFYVDKLKEKDQVLWSQPVVLHVPVVGFRKDGQVAIKEFADLAKPGVKVGLGDPKAMALGRTAEDILRASGHGDAILKNTVVRAATVKQLTLYVLKGTVDAAIIARADVFQNPDQLGMLEIDPAWYEAEVVTVALLRATQREADARKLAEYLASPAAVQVFNRFGFLSVK